MELTWKPLATEEWHALHPVPVGLAKVATADDLLKSATGSQPAATPFHAALVSPPQFQSLMDQLHPDQRHVAEAAEKVVGLVGSIPELRGSPAMKVVSLAVGSLNVGLTMRDAEWKDAAAITLKILEQIDTLSQLVDRPIPLALSCVIKAANFGVTLYAQFRDAKELAAGLTVVGTFMTWVSFQELQEKLEALSPGTA